MELEPTLENKQAMVKIDVGVHRHRICCYYDGSWRELAEAFQFLEEGSAVLEIARTQMHD